MITEARYGSWRSPITAADVAGKTIGLSEPRFDGDHIYWLEDRRGNQADEKARSVIVRCGPSGVHSDAFDTSFSARTAVHEYGGGAYTVADGVIYFSNHFDGQLYRILPGCTPACITSNKKCRFADLVIDGKRNRLICVRENHSLMPVKNEIVAVALDGTNRMSVLVTGNDFYSSPKISPDGKHIAWLTWNFPHMPWTSNELWTARFDSNGMPIAMKHIAGEGNESIFQPEWSPHGALYFVSDRTGWWNLYRQQEDRDIALLAMEADFGQAQWQFGQSTYAFVAPNILVCTYIKEGKSSLGVLDVQSGNFQALDLPFQDLSHVRARSGDVTFCAGSPLQSLAVVRIDLNSGSFKIVQSSLKSSDKFAPYFSSPQTIEFPTSQNRSAYGFYYPPVNPEFSAPKENLPPLLVRAHGGPTSASKNTLDLRTQYWTSHGFAVLDVNYGGSTGYGREYRSRLRGQWGVVDVDDCVNGAQFLAARGLVDSKNLAITGTSAGGYTTLCALISRNIFRVGASHYGIADLETFVQDTHKFESQYLEWLIAPYPGQAELYRERSPLHHASQLRVPVIFFQGEDDRVVPPSQSAAMAKALEQQRVPFRYVLFQGEQHGFRKQENVRQSLEEELQFYRAHMLGAAAP